ncbi:MOSC domain-containing protein [Chelatococcus sambhunathii]|uniref:MOSC domain-containing protein n=1 Tax=Chelatococcus sambhunathii TaxID=363953 RepID=A0ABU1DH92_9HYPH|nr:MOSC domain-containing protein [Chelatococcus sambhunathii]MDR4307449.1 MOSC domain-containing protein [Chelatococcus sambhunathii]
MSNSRGRVAALRRFPVKGLSPEPLDSVSVEPGRQIVGDRIYAIENGPSGFDAENPAKLPKTRFLCLMRNARLARLRSRFDHEASTLSVELDGETALSADLSSADGRADAERWFTDFMGEELNGPLKVLPAPGRHTFSDTSKGVLSLINLASVSGVEDIVGAAVDPLRFRGNLDFSGFDPWDELDWLDKEVQIGEVRFRVVQRTVRCAATEVDPQTAARDLPIPKSLMKSLGHADCGVYAEPLTGGTISVGDEIRVL